MIGKQKPRYPINAQWNRSLACYCWRLLNYAGGLSLKSILHFSLNMRHLRTGLHYSDFHKHCTLQIQFNRTRKQQYKFIHKTDWPNYGKLGLFLRQFYTMQSSLKLWSACQSEEADYRTQEFFQVYYTKVREVEEHTNWKSQLKMVGSMETTLKTILKMGTSKQ